MDDLICTIGNYAFGIYITTISINLLDVIGQYTFN